jgi:hypothetical protein
MFARAELALENCVFNAVGYCLRKPMNRVVRRGKTVINQHDNLRIRPIWQLRLPVYRGCVKLTVATYITSKDLGLVTKVQELLT